MTTTDATTVEATDRSKRADELEKSVRSKRSARLGDLPMQEVLLIAGGVLMPLGIVAVILGWYGTARTPFLFEQIPFLASGGFAGVALVMLGGFLYFGAWIARSVTESREQSERLVDAVKDLETRLGELQWASAGAAAGAAATAAGAPAAANNGYLVKTEKGTMVHEPTCSVVAHRDGLQALSPDEAKAQGLVPCKLCAPL